MSRLPAYNCYCLYIALKNHFTQESYDYFKYRGKTTVSKEAFLSRKDRYQFQKLSRVCDEAEMQDFLVANLIKDKKWVGDLLDEEAEINYKNYLKRKQSISYMFDNEIGKIAIHDIFKIKKDTYPQILYSYMQGKISLETLTILDHYIQFSKKYDQKYGKDDILWGKIRLASKKLTPFLEYDKVKIKSILKEKLNEQGSQESSPPASQAKNPKENKTYSE